MVPPIRKGDGTGVVPQGISEVRKGDGTVIFSGAIPDSVLLPESDDLTHFAGDTGGFEINNNAPKFNTEFTDLSLKHTSTTSDQFIGSETGLDRYPAIGDTHRVAVYLDNATNSLSDILFGYSSTTAKADGYGIRFFEPDGTNEFRIIRWDGGSPTTLATLSGQMSGAGWYEAEILHESNGDMTVTWYDGSGNQLGQSTASDSTHLTSGEYDNTGVGVSEGRGEADAYDFWRFV